MTDYISREATIEKLNSLCDRVCQYSKAQRKYMCGACPLGDAFTVIEDDIPAADVRPVVRGRWVNDHNGKYSAVGDNFYCSICKDPSLRAFGKPAKTNYCPNCGADMRIFYTNCENTATTGEDGEIGNLRAWLKNGQENKTK